MDLKELDQLSGPPEEHWYYAAKFDLLASAIKSSGAKRILDVGAGSGVFSRLLLERTDCQEAVCVDTAYDGDRDEIVNGKPMRFRRSNEERDFDIVLLMDVLEHVDDDVKLLKTVADTVRSGTHFFITVPAFQFLWSAHDVFLDHRRRYTAETLKATIERSGLTSRSVRYFYALIFPLVVLLRLLRRKRDPNKGSDLRPAPAGIGAMVQAALKLERIIIYPVNRVAGLSVVALARS